MKSCEQFRTEMGYFMRSNWQIRRRDTFQRTIGGVLVRMYIAALLFRLHSFCEKGEKEAAIYSTCTVCAVFKKQRDTIDSVCTILFLPVKKRKKKGIRSSSFITCFPCTFFLLSH
jgi:hypothetical protein